MDDFIFRLARLHPAPGAADELRELLCGPASLSAAGRDLVRAALQAEVAPLVYRHLPKSGGVSPEALQAIWGAYYANVHWNGKALKEIARILGALQAAGWRRYR